MDNIYYLFVSTYASRLANISFFEVVKLSTNKFVFDRKSSI